MIEAERREELDKVILRIQKLLAKGNDSATTPEESAAFVQKAQELLTKYDLSMESINDLKADKRTAIRKGDNVVRTTEGKPESWKENVLNAVARAHDCRVIYVAEYEYTPSGKSKRQVRHGKLIGFGHDVEAAGYEAVFLIGEITRLAQSYADVMWAQIRAVESEFSMTHQQAERWYVNSTGRHPLKAKLHFTKGATETIVDLIESWKWQRDEEARKANPYAIVLQKKAVVDEFVQAESYGMTVEKYREYRAQQEKELAEWRAANPPKPVKVEEPKPMTAKEKRAQEAWERKQSRYWDARDRKQEREFQNRDHDAHRAGREAASKISLRRGINEGNGNGKAIP